MADPEDLQKAADAIRSIRGTALEYTNGNVVYDVDYFRLCDTVLFEFRRTRAEKEELMSRRLNLELELPDDVVAGLQDEDLTSKAKEALVMELLREHRVSQGKAAAILGLNRADLFPLMTRYKVAVIDLTDAELREELNRSLPTD